MQEKYTVGHTIRTSREYPAGVPCILQDGDSVLCTFPSIPNGLKQAKEVCEILNIAPSLIRPKGCG